MAKKPDLSDFTKKFDFSGIVDNVRKMINPEGGTPNADPDDDVGVKLARISTLVQELQVAHEEQEKKLGKINQLVNALYEDLQVRKESVAEGEVEPASEIKQASKPAKKKSAAKKKSKD